MPRLWMCNECVGNRRLSPDHDLCEAQHIRFSRYALLIIGSLQIAIGAHFHRTISQPISRNATMVVILSEKDMLPPETLPQLLPPPPPYPASSSSLVSPPPFPGRRTHARFSSLPSHILLYIVHQTMPQSDGVYDGEGKVELQRKVLYWMTLSLRLVNRSFYIGAYSSKLGIEPL